MALLVYLYHRYQITLALMYSR